LRAVVNHQAQQQVAVALELDRKPQPHLTDIISRKTRLNTNMKKLLILPFLFAFSMQVRAQYVIPDTALVALFQQWYPDLMTGDVLDTINSNSPFITVLNFENTNVTDLSGIQYFDSVSTIYITNSPVSYIPELPDSLEYLYCDNTQLASLPPLPGTLVSLQIQNSPLTGLPALPDAMIDLRTINCPITSLPSLPPFLDRLVCMNGQLTSLPALPDTLYYLHVPDNFLTSLPPLPSNLGVLWVDQNQLTSLPELPPNLIQLLCNNNQLGCLPILPASLNQMNCTGNNLSCLPNEPPTLGPYGTGGNDSNLGFSPVVCGPGDACFPAEVVSGIIFNDMNGNGLLDAGELPFANGVAQAMPGNTLSNGDINGRYVLPVGVGSFTVQGQSVLYHTITTQAYAATLVAGQSDSSSHIGYQAIPGVYDLVAQINADATRPGFNNNVYVQVSNVGTEPTTAAITFDFETDQTWVSSSVTPATQTGNTANWTVTMAPGETWNATVTLHTDAAAPLGLAVDHDLNALNAINDTTPANNMAHWHDVTVGSFDPNDKTAFPAGMNPAQLESGAPIEYVIRFQNTGTYLAENVRVTDTLSNDLDLATFKYTSASHSNHWQLNDGVLVFQFDNILLPDSNANEPGSHGFVKFSIQPSQELAVGESITNIANIYFDYNQPVITEPCVFLIDATIGVTEANTTGIQLYPNPTNALLHISSEQTLKSVSVLQLDGRLVRNEIATGQQHQLDLSALQTGIYLVNVVTERGNFTSRVVVQR
jgi:uncharacterized repeat protein (TIGR01451 family)